MTEHFICTGGCNGVSEKPGTCQDPNCPKHGQALQYCDCGKPEHDVRRNQDEERPDDKKKEGEM